MKKFLNFFVLTAVVALTATSCYQEEIDNLQKQIDELTGSTIATIDSQIKNINASITDLQSVENSLSGYITSLQSDNSKIKGQIEDLTAVDKNLSTKIDELKSFVNGELKSSKDWANATFATLAQYDSLATVVAGIPAKIEAISKALGDAKSEITADYEKAIKDAVSASEESMKSWVNEKLTDYYTIAQLNATLDSLGQSQSAVDSTINAKIDEQKVALDTAKSQITAAYQSAIKTAVDSLEGKINTKLAQDIATAQSTLNGQITAINTEITNIKSRLDAVEANINALIAQIQSVRVIPQYSDGSVELLDAYDTISFDIKPTSAAQALADAWKIANNENRAKMVSFKIQEVMTKGTAPTAVIDTVFCENGEFKVYAQFQNLPDNAAASLVISSGKSDLSSEYFNLYQNNNYFYFEALEAGTVVSMKRYEDEDTPPVVSLQYSTNGSSWETFVVGTTNVTLPNIGDKVYFRAGDGGNAKFAESSMGFNHFKATDSVNVGGNIMYLLNGSNLSNTFNTEVNKNAFNSLFYDLSVLISASNLKLPATTLAERCYESMFEKCSSLAAAPSLPATTLAERCYESMFEKCSSLAAAPPLPATTLAEYCYRDMFCDCHSLTTAPDLKAITLLNSCYRNMFTNCHKLSSVTMLATTGLSAEKCLSQWLPSPDTDPSVTSRTVTINASLNPNDTTGAVKIIKEKSAGWGITNGTKALYAYESYGYGIEIDGVVWAPVNCGYDATNYIFGKLYQWGRKDGCGYNDNATYTETVIQTATAGPVSASSEVSSYFYYTANEENDGLTPLDSTRWNSKTGPDKETSPTKTNYDPCPTGWRVPTAAELKDLSENRSEWTSKDSQNGYWFSGKTLYSDSTSRVFLPAAGTRYFKNGNFDGRNSSGYYWSSSQNEDASVKEAKDLFIVSEMISLSTDHRANGYSVRCVKDSGQPQ